MHNELWGSAEIMANFYETIVFVNTLHPLTEAFLAFFLGLLLPPIQFALRLKKFWNKNSPSFFVKTFWSHKVFKIAVPLAFELLCNIMLIY